MPDSYNVLLTKIAQEEIDHIYDWWADHRSVSQAHRWYDAFFQKLSSLEENPTRFSLAPENDHFSYELRQLNFGVASRPTHRAVFTIRDTVVVVLRVRHLARSDIVEE